MKRFFPALPESRERLQDRLLLLAAVFVFLYALILTLSPAVYNHSWNVTYRWIHWIGFVVWLAGFWIVQRLVNRWLPEHDPYLLPLTALLSGWGLLAVWRINTYQGIRQTIWLAVSLAALAGVLRIPNLLQWLRKYKYVWLTCGILLTALTFLIGTYPSGIGPHLWLGLGGFFFQPSEPLKLLLVIYLAAYLADRRSLRFNLMQWLMPTLMLLIIALGILIFQRDLGTTFLFIAIYTVMIFLASGRRRVLLVSLAFLAAAGGLGYLLFGVIRLRVDSWINPWLDPSGNSYQIVQSLLAVASGGIFGRGAGIGSPSLVPLAQSDFIFASIAEESGLTGTLALFGLLALLAFRGLRIAVESPNWYQRYLSAGIVTNLSLQSILIIGGNIRLLPLTGVTLPFMSYGGSSLLVSILSVALLLLLSNNDREQVPASLANPFPYKLLAAGVLAGFASLALINGYWAVVQSTDLQTRADNARRAIADRYVKRGSVLDRNNQTIMTSQGQPGVYERVLLYPDLSSVIGYTNFTYGQTGLEKSMDEYLRGQSGNPASLVWWNHILYGQPPPGLDVRTSLDLQLQKQADTLLAGRKGALVLLNAKTGEILAMASSPTFDANQLDQKWDTWVQDPSSPFLNRAAQGQYPAGTAMGPFLLAHTIEENNLTDSPAYLTTVLQNQVMPCAFDLTFPTSWAKAVSNGCPGASIQLAQNMNMPLMVKLYASIGFFTAPSIPLDVAVPSPLFLMENLDLSAIGQDPLRVTPLQMALAAATLSNHGVRPAPRLAMAVHTPAQGWVVLPPGGSDTDTFSAAAADQAARLLTAGSSPYWETTAMAYINHQPYAWYLGGTLPDWKGAPLAIAVLIEDGNTTAARQIGSQMLTAAITQ